MDAVLGDINIAGPTADADMEDIAPSSVAKQQKKSKDKKEKKDKEGKKDKKRSHSEVNGDEAVSEKKKKKSRPSLE
jgi:nucleolar protein 56